MSCCSAASDQLSDRTPTSRSRTSPLRQELTSFASTRRRPRITAADRFFWVTLRRIWSRWLDVPVIVKPETVIRWHRTGFRCYWRWISRHRASGRPTLDPAIRDLIRTMVRDNPTWGAPRIHGELVMLGFDVSERTVSRYMPRRRPRPDAVQRWLVSSSCARTGSSKRTRMS